MNNNPAEKPAVSFRGSLNGYNKEDVNKYIEEINIKFSETESEYKKIIVSQKKQLDELNMIIAETKVKNDEASALREKYNSLQNEFEKNENEYKYAQEKNRECSAIIGALNDKLDILSAEYEKLKDNYEKITAERDALYVKAESDVNETETTVIEAAETKPEIGKPNPSDNEKARMYDKISRQVGSMLIDARDIAETIINDANIQAEKIIASAEIRANDICKDADIKLNHTLNYIKKTLRRMSSDCMSEYIEHINNSRSALDKILGDTTSEADLVYSRFDNIINNAIADLNKGIEKITVGNLPNATDS